MGRKSIKKERKPLTKKAKVWVRELIPLLQEKDLNNITLDDIASLANKSKSTIYTYFHSKEEIFQTAVQMVLEEMQYASTEEAVKGEDMEQALQNVLMHISKGIQGISIAFLDQIKQHYPIAWQEIEDFTGKLLQNLQFIYEKGMEAGSFRRFNTDMLILLDQHFIMNMITNPKLFQEERVTLEQLVKEYIVLRLSALNAK